MKKLLLFLMIGGVLGLVFYVSCGGGGGASPTTPASVPISIEGLDGATDVAVDSSFTYAFDSAIDTSTVDTSTFFIVPTPTTNLASPPYETRNTTYDIRHTRKAALDETTCDVANALATSVTCDSSTSCTLDPTSDLSNGTTYSLCLTTDISYAYNKSFLIREAHAASPFEGFMATFTTVEAADAGISTVNSLDGDTDVSTSSTFKYNFGKAVDTSTVTSSTFYLVTTTSADMSAEMYDSIYKAEFNSTTCNVNDAIAATITCDPLACTLTPSASLPGSTICITCLTNIFYEDGDPVPDFMASFTTAASTAPSVPANVAVTAGDAANTLSWDAVSGATSYNIYWANTSAVTTSDTKITGATSPYSHTSLTNGTAYYYVVTAVNTDGESGLSSEVSATPVAATPAAPDAPTNLAAVVGYGQLQFTWTAVSGATSYNIYHGTATGVTTANGIKVSPVTSPHTFTNIAGGTNRFVVVTAVNAGGESSASTEVSGTAGYRVFLTSVAGNGELGNWDIVAPYGEAGVDAGDKICELLASDASLTGTYKAWLSASAVVDAKDHITGDGPWGLVDGTTKVADNAADLIDTSINNAINVDEDGTTVSASPSRVWTGTDGDGTVSSDCSGWLDASGATPGDYGESGQTDGQWTIGPTAQLSSATSRLYCFETE